MLTDELVFNVAFLLERQALPAFDAAIERLDEALAGALSLRRIGPLPPYSFATVSVTRFDAQRLAAGRALLGLPGEISERPCCRATGRLARMAHPDHNPADPSAAERVRRAQRRPSRPPRLLPQPRPGRWTPEPGPHGHDRAERRQRAVAPEKAAMTEESARVYLYGVIRDGEPLVLDAPPINGDGPVRAIPHRGLAAVVSDDPLPRYELTRKNVRGHRQSSTA